MTCRTLISIFIPVVLLVSGCQGTGKVVNFDLQAQPSQTGSSTKAQDSLAVLVQPFQDTREKPLLGTRNHLWGGNTHFNAWNGDVSLGMARLAKDYLQQRGWKASVETIDSSVTDSSHDVLLTGQVLTFDANAKSRFGSTKIDVGLQVNFEAKNVVDESTVRMVLGSSGTETVMFFDPEDVQKLSSQVLKDLFDQLFKDLTVEDRAIRLRSNTD